MEHSELFLLLPKYEEVVGQPDYIKSKNIMTEDEILKVIKKAICSSLQRHAFPVVPSMI